MLLVYHLKQYFIILFLSLIACYKSFSQCAPQTGLPSSNLTFNSAADGSGFTLPASTSDLHWKVAVNSITGPYNPAIVMSSVPTDYYQSSLLAYAWISYSATGTHTGSQDFFYKRDFILPCYNLCGKSYDEDNVFCLDLNMYADNSIYEIYINGIPQSGNVGNIFPVPNPYRPAGIAGAVKTPVTLCKDWKAGNNSIIIQVASSANLTGLLVESSFRTPPITDSVKASICQGEVFQWGNKPLKQSGYYSDTFHISPGCDSVRTLSLAVNPKSQSIINQSICEGQSFSGYSTSGTYIDQFVSTNGCDSMRTLHLSVLPKPDPGVPSSAAFCNGDSLMLMPGAFQSYLWQDGSTQNHYTVKRPGLYFVTVNNICGSVKKEIQVTEKTCNIYFPNAFTPNQDGKNELFRILTSYTFQEYYLSIYDRWGQKIFETTDPAKGWNGYFKGQFQRSGIFVWYCRFKRSGIMSTMKGTVVLVQ